MIDVDPKSFFLWCRAVAPVLLAAGEGRIGKMSSLSAYTGGVAAAVSKFA